MPKLSARNKRHNGDSPLSTVKKRKRSKTTATPDKHLINVLTGADDHNEEARPAPNTIQQDSPQHDDQQHEQTTVQNIKLSSQIPPDSKDLAQASESQAPSDAWMRPLTEAHAKKVNVIVLLERANLETIKHNSKDGGVVLLNCDDHKHVLRKTNREANDARPDITHQCLLSLMDSPLNKAGRLKVYIRTAKNVLIDVHPQTRIPRTTRRFNGLMAELLEKFKVRGTAGSIPLFKVIRNPITSHLPVGTRKIVCTYNTENIVDVRHHAHEMASLAMTESERLKGAITPSEDDISEHAETVNVLYVVGAMAHGKVTEEWADDNICVSEYPLSASTVCSRITYAYESLFGIM